jgi:hypothetical protein
VWDSHQKLPFGEASSSHWESGKINGLVTNVHALNGHYFCLSDLPVRTVYFNPVDYKLIALAASYIWGPSIPRLKVQFQAYLVSQA